jgi:hypothetical protein
MTVWSAVERQEVEEQKKKKKWSSENKQSGYTPGITLVVDHPD